MKARDVSTAAAARRNPVGTAFICALVLLAFAGIGASSAMASPPTLSIEPATGVRYTTAHLSGTVEVPADGFETYWCLETAQEGTEAWSGFCFQGPVQPGETATVETDVGGLIPGTHYEARLSALNFTEFVEEHSTESQPNPTFETEAVAKPTVTIGAPSAVGATTAMLTGTVDPNAPKEAAELQGGSPEEEAINAAFRSEWHFECTPGCGFVSGAPVEADNTAHAVEAEATGLQPHTTYTVKLVASNAGGSEEASESGGQPVTFTTAPDVPIVDTSSVSAVSTGQATLHAGVNPRGASTTVRFAYVTQAQFEAAGFAGAAETPASAPIGSDNTDHQVAQTISGLQPETVYRFHALATNPAGTGTGPDRVFQTLAPPAPPGEACSNEALRLEQSSEFLPDCRAYEMVSPPDKNGGDIIADTQRTRAAVDGNAIDFTSLAGFADVRGSGISNDYIANRSTNPTPGDNGWATHGIMPPLRSLSTDAVFARVNPQFQGEFSPDLDRGVFFAWGALNGEPNVDGVANLYRGRGLRSPAGGAFDLVSSSANPLSPYQNTLALELNPILAESTPDLEHVAFESYQGLTTDAPAQPPQCDLSLPSAERCRARVYEWDEGKLSLAGRVPADPATESSCDDETGPGCVVADVSIAEQGDGRSRAGTNNRTPHAITVDAAGHVRLFFTQPTDAENLTSTDTNNNGRVNRASSGRIFMREDAHRTVQINASERTTCAADLGGSPPCEPAPETPTPATLLDASADGTRVFFISLGALTDDAPADGASKLYMYSVTPDAEGHHLTFLSPDHEPADGAPANVNATIGASDDGHYVYFVAFGQLVNGASIPSNRLGIYVWHDGTVAYVGAAPVGVVQKETTTLDTNWVLTPNQARVTSDGRHLLFPTADGSELLPAPYDHGSCPGLAGGGGCRELYVYSADGSTPAGPDLACASCNPSGAAALTHAAAAVWINAGAALTSFHKNHAISNDGTRVFFTTGDALVPRDTNGKLDAYEWTADGTHGCHSTNIYNHGCLSLLSSGTDPAASYFLDASPDGANAFFVTRQRLVGWDGDGAYDLYDARVGGGFPEPPATTAPCNGDSCRGPGGGGSSAPPAGTAAFIGPGNQQPHLRCPKGRRAVKRHGKTRCVARKHHRKHKRANTNRRSGR